MSKDGIHFIPTFPLEGGVQGCKVLVRIMKVSEIGRYIMLTS